MKTKAKLKNIFGKVRIVGLAGNKSTGKTNNLMHLVKDFRKYNKTTEIFCFGLPEDLKPMMDKLNMKEISSVGTW